VCVPHDSNVFVDMLRAVHLVAVLQGNVRLQNLQAG
jgi:hypothetical protein